MQINPIESQRRGSATWHFEHYVQRAVPPTDHHIYTDFSMATFILSTVGCWCHRMILGIEEIHKLVDGLFQCNPILYSVS
jgi:hypothetical protein